MWVKCGAEKFFQCNKTISENFLKFRNFPSCLIRIIITNQNKTFQFNKSEAEASREAKIEDPIQGM